MLNRLGGRRPSASMIVSLVALFFAVGGVGYAATQLPANSVGTRQIQNNAVTFNKIAPHTVGSARINQGLVQTRVTGNCVKPGGAISAVNQNGSVSCHTTRELGSSSGTVTIATTSTKVASEALPAGTFLLFADPYASITPVGSGSTTVSCTLSVAGGSSLTRSIVVTNNGHQQFAFPLTLPSSVPSKGATATLSCTKTAALTTTVAVTSTLNALETSSNA